MQYIFICLADAVAAFICSGKSLRRKLTAGVNIVALLMTPIFNSRCYNISTFIILLPFIDFLFDCVIIKGSDSIKTSLSANEMSDATVFYSLCEFLIFASRFAGKGET